MLTRSKRPPAAITFAAVVSAGSKFLFMSPGSSSSSGVNALPKRLERSRLYSLADCRRETHAPTSRPIAFRSNDQRTMRRHVAASGRSDEEGKLPTRGTFTGLCFADRRRSSQRDRLATVAFGGSRHGFGPCTCAQVPEQGFHVKFHSVKRDVQSARDRLVGHAFRQRGKHFQFARRQQPLSLRLAYRAKAIPRTGAADDQTDRARAYLRSDLARIRFARQRAAQAVVDNTKRDNVANLT